MKAYLDILSDIVNNGKEKNARTDVGTIYNFASRFRHDLREGFPLLTTKKINPLLPLVEMFAFCKGATNTKEFHELECHIWDAWALENDYVEINPKRDYEIFKELAEIKGISVEEAEKIIVDVETKHKLHAAKLREIAATGSQEASNEYLSSEEALNSPSKVEFLNKEGITIFRRDVILPAGSLGPIYGEQWLRWKTSDGRMINQLADLVRLLKNEPTSRRIVLLGWNPEHIPYQTGPVAPDGSIIKDSKDRIKANIQLGKMALPPCHLMTIFDVDTSGDIPVLNLHQIMRSSDVPVGLPFNIAGYAYLLELLAKQLGMVAGELVIDSTNAHIYNNQHHLAEIQLEREPYPLPTITIPDGIDLLDPETLTLENAKRIVAGISNYQHHDFIKYPVAV